MIENIQSARMSAGYQAQGRAHSGTPLHTGGAQHGGPAGSHSAYGTVGSTHNAFMPGAANGGQSYGQQQNNMNGEPLCIIEHHK